VFLRTFVPEGADVAVHIIQDGMERNDAHILEAALIDQYGRVMLGNGSLLNLGDGGRFNGQRMHTAKAHHVAGLPNPFVKMSKKRRRPPPGARKLAEVLHKQPFGLKTEDD
jgi:hypothetical protein